MVNFLEVLYVATAASALAAAIAWLRHARAAARRLGAVALTCGLAAAALSWYLTPPR